MTFQLLHDVHGRTIIDTEQSKYINKNGKIADKLKT